MIVIKAIKPARFKSEVFREETTKAARAASVKIQEDFKRTTKSWSFQPYFERVIQVGPASIQVLVGTEDPIYRYVDEGTKPHLIPKAGPGLLVFSEGYRAKTTPGVLHSQSGGAFGNKVIVFKQVHHPGTKARNFDKLIQKKWVVPFRKMIEEAMKTAAKRSGHAI